jgi:sensor histidine kinase YesM
VANVLPPAMLGLAVLRLCARLPWRSEPVEGAAARSGWRRLVRRFAGRRRRFFVVHAACALLYATLSFAGTSALFIGFDRVRTGSWPGRFFDLRVAAWQFFIALLLYTLVASLAYAAALVVRLRDEEARLARLSELQTRAELKALRARLDPHFLFNTLHSLLALVRRDPRAAEEALERFGGLLHYVLRGQEEGEQVRLAEEWGFVRDYLEIEALRLGERLRVEAAVDAEAGSCLVPAFSLQPLVENAIRYGIAPRANGGRLAVRASVEGGLLHVEVADDGVGAEPEEVGDGGQGLALVRERLRAAHGARAALEVETAPGAGFVARLRLPAVPAALPEGEA